MNLISIQFNDSMNITSHCTKNRGNLIKYYRSYQKYKKIYGSIESIKRSNQVPTSLESASQLPGDSTLVSSTTSSQVQLRNFNNEMILIKKEKNIKLEPISNTERKLNSLETKLNDFIRQQQLRRTSKFRPDKYTDISPKIFQPKFCNESLLRAEKSLKSIEQERQRTSSFSFTKNFPTPKQQQQQQQQQSKESPQPTTADPKETLADQNDNLIVKGLFAIKDNSQSKTTYLNSIKPKLVPIKVITNKTFTSSKRVISKSADTESQQQLEKQQQQQYLVDLEPMLSKSQCAYTSAVSSSSQLKSYPFRLNSLETAATTATSQCSNKSNLEYIQNQKQVYILHRDILNRIQERSMSSMSKYKTRINIEGEISEIMNASSPANLFNAINKSYKFYERVRSKPSKIKSIKPNSVPATMQKPSARRILLKHLLNKEEQDEEAKEEENFSDEDEDEEDFDEDYDEIMDELEETNLK